MTQIELLEEELQKLEVKYISMILEYRKEKRLIFEKAKETHKQEIIDAFKSGLKSPYHQDYTFVTQDNQEGTKSGQYYQETFVSKGSDTLKDYHIVDTNEMVDQVPDVRKMVEDDVEKLAVEWIDKNSHKWSNNTNEVGDNYGSFVAGYNKAKEMHKQEMAQLPKQEISDEEIEKAVNEYAEVYQCPSEVKMCKHDVISAWNNAIKWYREQLKSKQ